MEDNSYTVKVRAHGKSRDITIPKDIVDKMSLKPGSKLNAKLSKDIINMYKPESLTPLDVVSEDIFDLATKIRQLRSKELQIREERIKEI